MTWGLSKEHLYFTNAEAEDIMTRLRTIVDTKRKFKKGVLGTTNTTYKPYYGFVRETTFDFFNTPTMWPHSSIQVIGKVNKTDSDSIKKVTIKIVPANNLIPAILAIFLLLFLMMSIVIFAKFEIVLPSLLMAVAGMGFVYVPFQINYLQTRDKLESMLRLRDIA